MNLHGVVRGAIRTINPDIPVTIQQSTGYTTSADGTQVPQYSSVNTSGQMQAMTGKDLQKIAGLNIQGVFEKIYLNGNYEGVFRVAGKGGDLLVINGRTYLVVAVLERWPDWCALALTMQLD